MSTFRILFSKTDLVRFAALLLVMLGGSFLELASLGAVPAFVGMFTAPDKMSRAVNMLNSALDAAGLPQPRSLTLWAGLALALLFIVRTLYLVASYAIQERMLANRHVAIASRLFRAYMNAPYTYHLLNNSATAVNNIIGEVENIIRYVLDATLNLIRNAIVLIAILCLLLAYDPVACLGAFTALAVAAGGFFLATRKRLSAIGIELYKRKQEVLKTISEGLGAYREIQLLDKKDAFCTHLHHSLEAFCALERSHHIIAKSTWPFMELFTCLVILGTMAAMLLWQNDKTTVPQTIALVAVCLARLKGNISEMMIFAEYRKAHASVIQAIAKDLEHLEKNFPPLPRNARLPSLSLKSFIAFKHISFRFPNTQKTALKDITLNIPSGSSLAIVGPTGAGKSTVANIAACLLTPQEGVIEVDGYPLRTPEDIRAWQNIIGVVPQDIMLLDDSIRANITFDLEDGHTDMDALDYAVRTAQLKPFIDSLADGLNTRIGEKGVRLSGGQKQRIAIARALYRKPPCIIFDEATSALDVSTEQDITDALNAMHGTHTLIVIAHRLSTVRHCDAIAFIRDGELAGIGNFEKLQAELPDFNSMTRI